MKAWVALLGLALLAGCSDGGTDDDGNGGGDSPVMEGGPATTTFNGSVQASIGTPHISFNYGGAYVTELPRGENTTGWVLELVWTPEAPTNDRLSLWIRDADAGNVMDPNALVTPIPPVARADGTSPVRLVAMAEDVPDEPHSILVRAADDQGVTAEQPFTVYITTFDHVPVDSEFSALG